MKHSVFTRFLRKINAKSTFQIIRKASDINKKFTVKLDGKIFVVSKTNYWQICRALILARDKLKCCNCQVSVIEVLTVHHLDGNHENNSLKNLLTLCFNCHILTHRGAIDKLEDIVWGRKSLEWDLKILKKLNSTKRGDPDNCIFHPDRRTIVTIGYNLKTGKLLPTNKRFGACSECSKVILEDAP